MYLGRYRWTYEGPRYLPTGTYQSTVEQYVWNILEHLLGGKLMGTYLPANGYSVKEGERYVVVRINGLVFCRAQTSLIIICIIRRSFVLARLLARRSMGGA